MQIASIAQQVRLFWTVSHRDEDGDMESEVEENSLAELYEGN